MNPNNVNILVNPEISPSKLLEYYVRNGICEGKYDDENIAFMGLKDSHLNIGAFIENEVVGLIRVLKEGLSAEIVEFSLDLKLQGYNRYEEGCMLETDPHDIAKQMFEIMRTELAKRGINQISRIIVEDIEETLYKSFGLVHNPGHKQYVWDGQPFSDFHEKHK